MKCPSFIAIETERGELVAETSRRPPEALRAKCRPTRIEIAAHKTVARVFLCNYCMKREVGHFGDFCRDCKTNDLYHWRKKGTPFRTVADENGFSLRNFIRRYFSL